MYQRVTLMKVNGLLDMPIEKLIYIYKLTAIPTGHYYIGQTGSIKDSMYQHLTAIIKATEGDNFTCGLQGPACTPDFITNLALHLKRQHPKDKGVKMERFAREALSVYIIALVADKETANLVERHYINVHRKDKYCLT